MFYSRVLEDEPPKGINFDSNSNSNVFYCHTYNKQYMTWNTSDVSTQNTLISRQSGMKKNKTSLYQFKDIVYSTLSPGDERSMAKGARDQK